MSENKLPPDRVDELARRLQGSLRQDRPRSWLIVLVALVVCSALLGGLAWWLYPRPELPRLEVIALDGLARADETPQARAYLAVPEPEPEFDTSVLRGQEILFTGGTFAIPPGAAAPVKKASTDALGRASVEWPGAQPGRPTTFQARYINVERRHGSNDDATLFVAEKGRPLLVVDVEETLATVPPAQWPALHPAAINVQDGAGKALHKLAEKHALVYLTVHAAQPLGYRKVRGWVGSKRGGPGGLPAGPVLGRSVYSGPDDLSEARASVLRDLQSRFAGPVIALVGTAASAETARAARVQTIRVGEGGIAWNEVAAPLRP
jgi:hypothetical protein